MSASELTSSRRKLRFEALEGRYLLSGNVLVSVNAMGDLVILGDNAANGVLVQQTFTDYVITGLTTSGATTINGAASIAVPRSSVTHDLRINMKNGNDVVELGTWLSFLEVKHDLIADLGPNGNKVLLIDTVHVNHNAWLTSGNGQDIFDIKQFRIPFPVPTIVGGKLSLHTGAGNKMISITDTIAEGGAEIEAGGGDHLIGLAGLDVDGPLEVSTGQGNNVILATKNLGTINGAVDDFALGHPFFNTTLYVNAAAVKGDLSFGAMFSGNSFTARDAQFETGWLWGNDFIDIDFASVSGNLEVEAGNGLNVIGISATQVRGDAQITTGSQDDLVALLAVAGVNHLYVNTGWGHDHVGVSVSAVDAAFLNYGLAHPSTDLGLLKAEFDHWALCVDWSLSAASVNIDTGWGNDKVWFTEFGISEFADPLAKVSISLGFGGDLLVFHHNTFGTGVLDGGWGNDTLDTSGNANSPFVSMNFETTIP